jgi:hypothetical protein
MRYGADDQGADWLRRERNSAAKSIEKDGGKADAALRADIDKSMKESGKMYDPKKKASIHGEAFDDKVRAKSIEEVKVWEANNPGKSMSALERQQIIDDVQTKAILDLAAEKKQNSLGEKAKRFFGQGGSVDFTGAPKSTPVDAESLQSLPPAAPAPVTRGLTSSPDAGGQSTRPPLTDKEKKILEWARKNPKNPDAAAALKRMGIP